MWGAIHASPKTTTVLIKPVPSGRVAKFSHAIYQNIFPSSSVAFCAASLSPSFSLGRLPARIPSVFFLRLSSAASATMVPSWLSVVASFFNYALFRFGVLMPLRLPLHSSPSGCACTGSIIPDLPRFRFTVSSFLSTTTGHPLIPFFSQLNLPFLTLLSRSFAPR